MCRQSKKLLNSSTSSTCSHNMVNFGPLTAEICWRVWGNPANFKGFRVLAALLHGTLVVGVGQTLRRWTEGAIFIRQGDHHVGHWPTFLVFTKLLDCTYWCSSVFTARRNALIASAVLATAIPSVRPSVCLSVRHTPVLCQNYGT